jgi:anti-sigma factor RsiW
MTGTACPHEIESAAYALGTLGPGERAAFAEHLATCPRCQAALDSVAGLPGLLARVRADDLPTAQTPPPDPAMFDRLLARATRQRHARRRRLVAAVAAVVMLFGLGGAGWVLVGQRADPVQVVAGSSGTVRLEAWLRPSAAGTAVRIELSGVPSEEHCRLVMVGNDGRREIAATWEASYQGTVSINGSTAIPPDRLTWLRIETDDAQPLIRLKVP